VFADGDDGKHTHMSIGARSFGFILALGATVAVLLLPPKVGGTSAAESSVSTCPKGAVCLWTKINFTGRRYVFYDDVGNFARYSGLGDNVESIKKKRPGIAVLWAKKGGGGAHRCFETPFGVASLGAFNNQASSLGVYKRIFACPVDPP
jgi:hypothetical protein